MRLVSFITLSSLSDGLRSFLSVLMRQTGQSYQANALRSVPGQLSVDTYWQLVEEQHHYRTRFLEALDAGHFDAILCPPHALPALAHGSSGLLDATNAGSYAILYNLLGMPAGVAPITRVQEGEESERQVGRDRVERAARAIETGSTGLPVGVQVVARHWREDIVLALMATLEEQTGAFVQPQ